MKLTFAIYRKRMNLIQPASSSIIQPAIKQITTDTSLTYKKLKARRAFGTALWSPSNMNLKEMAGYINQKLDP